IRSGRSTRTYRVVDCCDPDLPVIELGPQQIIREVGTPTITCPETTAYPDLELDDECSATLTLIAPKQTSVDCEVPDVRYSYTLNPGAINVTNLTEAELNLETQSLKLPGTYTLVISASLNGAVVQTADGDDDCTFTFNVIDDTVPTLECGDLSDAVEANLSVSTSNGTTTVEAVLLATDFAEKVTPSMGCPPAEVALQIRQKDSGDAFGSSISYDCTNVGETYVIEIRAINTVNGNVSVAPYCEGSVTITDAQQECPIAVCIAYDARQDEDGDGYMDYALDANGEASLTAADFADLTQSVGTLSVSYSPAAEPFNCFDLGKQLIATVTAEKNGITSAACITPVQFEVVDTLDPFYDNSSYSDGFTTEAVVGTPTTITSSSLISPVLPSTLDPQDNCGGLTLVFRESASDAYAESFSITCADVDSDVTIEIAYRDASGNFSLAQSLLIDCVAGRISGRIASADGSAMVEVPLKLIGDDMYTTVTDKAGQYEFGQLSKDQTYIIIPEKSTAPLNGVSTFDILLVAQHILGTNEFTSPYQYIAADVNKDGRVSVTDIVQMRQLILNILTEYPDNDSWRFVDGSYKFGQRVDPLRADFPERYVIDALTEDMEINFTGIKVGDINGNATPDDRPQSGIRSGETLNFLTDAVQLQKGKTYRIPITAVNFEEVLGFQFSIEADPTFVKLTGWEAGALQGLSDANFNFHRAAEGLVNTSWISQGEQQLATDDVLFYLNVQALANIDLEDVLQFGSTGVRAEAYEGTSPADALVSLPQLLFGSEEGASAFTLYQNRPNPFDQETLISFQLPEAATVTLQVYDVTGQLLRSTQLEASKGWNDWRLSANELPQQGIYYYRLESAFGSATRKMILIQ
ncbi:MAG: T9SS type A sorting domain-containing protein, partial [Bacteroidota bacterium]